MQDLELDACTVERYCRDYGRVGTAFTVRHTVIRMTGRDRYSRSRHKVYSKAVHRKVDQSKDENGKGRTHGVYDTHIG